MNNASKMRCQLRVGLDVDGVLADFLPNFLIRVARKLDLSHIPSDSVKSFGFKDHPVIPSAVAEECLQAVARDADFWLGLPSLVTPEDWIFLETLSRAERLCFITNRFANNMIDVEQITIRWFRGHGVSKPVVHVVSDEKGTLARELGITHFVDDRHENCLDVAEKSRASVYMPLAPYNRSFHHPKIRRIQKVGDLLADLRALFRPE